MSHNKFRTPLQNIAKGGIVTEIKQSHCHLRQAMCFWEQDPLRDFKFERTIEMLILKLTRTEKCLVILHSWLRDSSTIRTASMKALWFEAVDYMELMSKHWPGFATFLRMKPLFTVFTLID